MTRWGTLKIDQRTHDDRARRRVRRRRHRARRLAGGLGASATAATPPSRCTATCKRRPRPLPRSRRSEPMLRLHDNKFSGNGYKMRLLLTQLGMPLRAHRLRHRSRRRRARRIFCVLNPNGRIPVLEFDDGRVLAEFDAILVYLAEGTPYLPQDPLRACAGAAMDVLRAIRPRAQ